MIPLISFGLQAAGAASSIHLDWHLCLDFAVGAYCLVGLGLMAQGFRYFCAGQFMHYHAEAIRERWSELRPAEQRLVLGLLKGFGAGMFCLGIAVAVIAYVPLHAALVGAALERSAPIGRVPSLAPWFLGFVSILYTGMLVRVTRFALLPGATPIVVTITMCALCVAATMSSIAVVL